MSGPFDFIKKVAPYVGGGVGMILGGPGGAAAGYGIGSGVSQGIDALDGDPEGDAERAAQADKLARMKEAERMLTAYRPISQEATMQGMRQQMGAYDGARNLLGQMYGQQALPNMNTQNPFTPGRGPGSPGGPVAGNSMYAPMNYSPAQRPPSFGQQATSIVGYTPQQRPVVGVQRQPTNMPLTLRELMEQR